MLASRFLAGCTLLLLPSAVVCCRRGVPANACTYKLKVKTARARYAGTHDHIKIELSDIRRMTRWIGLSGPGHDLSRNSIGRYTFKATCFTRYPACVKLQSFGPFNNEHICFAGDSWKVDYIHLALTAGGLGWNETYKFNEWLNCNHKARC